MIGAREGGVFLSKAARRSEMGDVAPGRMRLGARLQSALGDE
jgi:hypothetical protein